MQVKEWSYLDGVHNFEDVSILVIEAGGHRLQDGTVLVAGSVTVNQNWTSVNFGITFNGIPVVFSQCMTRNGRDPVVTRQRNITTTRFDVRLQEEERKASGPHADETVGYVALYR